MNFEGKTPCGFYHRPPEDIGADAGSTPKGDELDVISEMLADVLADVLAELLFDALAELLFDALAELLFDALADLLDITPNGKALANQAG